jgi:hypothetical protein
VPLLDFTTGKTIQSFGVPGTSGVGTGGPQTAGALPGAATGGSGGYQDILQNDPIYQQLLKTLSAEGVADEAGARAQAQRGFINFGDTTGFDPYNQWVDDPTRALAQKNTTAGLSIHARLQKQQKDNVRSLRNALAARGGLRSGELGHQLGEESLRYSQAQFDARSQLTDFLAGISAALANAQRARSAQQASGVSDAVGRAPTTPPGTPPQPPPPTSSGDPYTGDQAATGGAVPWWLRKEAGFYSS